MNLFERVPCVCCVRVGVPVRAVGEWLWEGEDRDSLVLGLGDK